jgi:DNA repair exonuclease SbcCD ATPase subunit
VAEKTDVDEAARALETALVSQLARLLAEHRQPEPPKKWWEKGGYVAALGAFLAAVGPIVSATFDIMLESRKHEHEVALDLTQWEQELARDARARRENYLQLVINAESSDARHQILDLVIGAPWASEEEVAWATTEKGRELGELERLQRELSLQQAEVQRLSEELAKASAKLGAAIKDRKPTAQMEKALETAVGKLTAAEDRVDTIADKVAARPPHRETLLATTATVKVEPEAGTLDRFYVFVDRKKRIASDGGTASTWTGPVVPGKSRVRCKVFGQKGAKALLTILVQGQPAIERTLTIDGNVGEVDLTL